MADTAEKCLVVLMAGKRVGVVEQGDNGRLSLQYDEQWRLERTATPLSLSMPLAQRTHHDASIRPFLSGLLPDNERVIERWARDYQVSSGNPFALLRHVGEDCAGAAQFVKPERVDAILGGDGGVQWLGEDVLAERLRTLRADPTSWHVHDNGQFSLAGAQAKTALFFDPGTRRWGEPWGAAPTTHILKPAVAGLDEHDLTEHLCLAAANRAGLPAARSEVVAFGRERAIVVERYDRRAERSGGPILRVHQEDVCQALGIAPTMKYQNEGGPTPEQIIDLFRREIHPVGIADANIARFVDALAFNWIIAGTDAHAKNYSLLLAGRQVRLAPLYDVASALPYDDMYLPRLRMAMRVGGEDRIERISGRHWRRFAETNRLDPEETVARVDALAARTPGCFADAAGDNGVRALGSALPTRLADRVATRADQCRRALARD
ncbi:type II toxin-antitoxin system HipA family toxin [Actinoplanes sp. NPDC049548]|uniref:type II toxin-antitoxin system HipA family toxin n=1 Tax=Actinoplanes sp. NPDC049548 TaxID=3155152 RepID=UPI003440EA33